MLTHWQALATLPPSLWTTVVSTLLLAQRIQPTFAQSSNNTLQLNQSLALNTSTLTTSTYSLPPANASTSRKRTISIALCNTQDASSPTLFFATNNSAVTDPGQDNAQELVINADGLANLTLEFDGVNESVGSGMIGIDAGSSSQAFEIGVTDTDGAWTPLPF